MTAEQETEVTIDQALNALGKLFGENSYRVENLRREVLLLDMDPIIKRFREEYGGGWWAYGSTDISYSKTFDTREEAMEWIMELGLGEPKFSKESFCDKDGNPMTECSLEVEGKFENINFTIKAGYTRNGMSTPSCKVVERVSYSVVCDVQNYK